MTEIDDMLEEAGFIQRIYLNAEKLRKALQKRAVDKMARGESVNEMMHILQITKKECEDDL